MTHPDESHLFSLVVDRNDGPADWKRLMTLAPAHPELWTRLAEMLRDDALLRDALGEALAGVDSVDLPQPACPSRAASVVGSAALRKLGRPWLGWAAAALVLAAWWLAGADQPLPRLDLRDPTTSASLAAGGAAGAGVASPTTVSLSTPPEVLYEFPMTLVGTAPRADGPGLEVLYIQRLLRREVVEDVYELARDELGNPQAIPLRSEQLLVSDLL